MFIQARQVEVGAFPPGMAGKEVGRRMRSVAANLNIVCIDPLGRRTLYFLINLHMRAAGSGRSAAISSGLSCCGEVCVCVGGGASGALLSTGEKVSSNTAIRGSCTLLIFEEHSTLLLFT